MAERRRAPAAALVLLAAAAGGLVLFGPQDLPLAARLSLAVFGAASLLWISATMSAAFVALAAAAILVAAGAVPQARLAGALGADIVWLMIGAFILGEAIARTGLGARMTRSIAARARRTSGLFWLVAAALVPLTFLVPSTSGRAAIVLPLHRSLAPALGPQGARALALLIPVVILTTTIAALTGAGSHLIANDLLAGMTGRRIGFLDWAIYGLPFALLAGACACWVVQRMFLDAGLRARPLAAAVEAGRPWTAAERRVAAIAGLMLGLWLSEPWHGLSVATVAVLGALALVSPAGVLSWNEGLGAVSWDLVLFVAGALVLGQALIDTGAAAWLTGKLFAALGLAAGMSQAAAVAGIAAATTAAHLVMTSHAARAAALVPPLVVLAEALRIDPVAVVFIGTAGMNYCLTLPVSSKALLMFQGVEGGIRPGDLARLSAVLAPLHVGLILLFALTWWRWTGLTP